MPRLTIWRIIERALCSFEEIAGQARNDERKRNDARKRKDARNVASLHPVRNGAALDAVNVSLQKDASLTGCGAGMIFYREMHP